MAELLRLDFENGDPTKLTLSLSAEEAVTLNRLIEKLFPFPETLNDLYNVLDSTFNRFYENGAGEVLVDFWPANKIEWKRET